MKINKRLFILLVCFGLVLGATGCNDALVYTQTSSKPTATTRVDDPVPLTNPNVPTFRTTGNPNVPTSTP